MLTHLTGVGKEKYSKLKSIRHDQKVLKKRKKERNETLKAHKDMMLA
jgi:hypothetical protein